METLGCYLERNRIAAVPSDERNFPTFASPEERPHLHFQERV